MKVRNRKIKVIPVLNHTIKFMRRKYIALYNFFFNFILQLFFSFSRNRTSYAFRHNRSSHLM